MPYTPTNIVDLSANLITNPLNPNALYEVPNASMEVLQNIINATWNQGQEAKYDFSAKIAALSDAGGPLNGVTLPTDIAAGVVTAPLVAAPTITIADTAAGDVYADFSTEYVALGTWLAGKFADFRTTYFPDESVAYTAAEDWLQAALANPSGLPATVLSQLLADEQARTLTDTTRASDAVIASFAARRFPLPPGAAASAVLQIQQTAQDKMAEASRKITVMSVDNLKFAVEKTLGLRQSAMASAVDYIKTLASAPEMSSRLVNIGYDAQSKMISSAAQFYGAQVNAAEMVNKVAEFNVSSKLSADEKNQMVDMSMVDAKLKALLSEAQSIAQMATSMFNNLHASVSMTAGGTTISSTAQDLTA